MCRNHVSNVRSYLFYQPWHLFFFRIWLPTMCTYIHSPDFDFTHKNRFELVFFRSPGTVNHFVWTVFVFEGFFFHLTNLDLKCIYAPETFHWMHNMRRILNFFSFHITNIDTLLWWLDPLKTNSMEIQQKKFAHFSFKFWLLHQFQIHRRTHTHTATATTVKKIQND